MSVQPKLIAWHGQQAIKDKYVARIKAHAAADKIIQGVYWENGKGCAVGCSIESNDHYRYETEMGVPVAIAFLEDGLFEALPAEKAKAFPLQFVEAIEPGADLSLVTSHCMLDMFDDPDHGLLQLPDLASDVASACRAVADCYRLRVAGNEPTDKQWNQAGDLAQAARDAWDAWAAWAAWDAWAARDAWDAWAASAAWDAWDAWDATAEWQVDRLLHHLANAPMALEAVSA